jgi:hypothetical protein
VKHLFSFEQVLLLMRQLVHQLALRPLELQQVPPAILRICSTRSDQQLMTVMMTTTQSIICSTSRKTEMKRMNSPLAIALQLGRLVLAGAVVPKQAVTQKAMAPGIMLAAAVATAQEATAAQEAADSTSPSSPQLYLPTSPRSSPSSATR